MNSTKTFCNFLKKYFIILVFLFNNAQASEPRPLKINKINVIRNNKNSYLTDELILNSIPYKEGEFFNPHKTSKLIRNLNDISKPFSYFNQIQVMGKQLPNNMMNLYVFTYEKNELLDVNITGNSKIKTLEINNKFKFEDIHAINETDLQKIANEIRKMYREKDHHLAQVETKLVVENNKVKAFITVCENKKSLVKRVFFKGNNCIASKKLSSIIFTREDWLFGFVNKAGSYKPEALEQDKFIIESYYKSHGYFNAKVTNIDVKLDPFTKQYCITFEIEEGDLYTVENVKVFCNENISEEQILNTIPLKAGQLYSAKDLRDSIESLRTIWGQYGYVFADIDPIVIPDDATKTISVTFNTELGDKVFVNRVNILGNKKTKEYVIRRKLSLDEGDLLTTTKMDYSKDRVENLGFFDPMNGVNWKINRLNDQNADLDLIVNEIKTGRIAGNIGFGGSPTNLKSVTQSFRFGGSIHDTNLFGEGILLKGSGEWSKEEWTVAFNLANPYSFGRSLYTEADLYVTNSSYSDELKNTTKFRERVIGAFLGTGFSTTYFSLIRDATITFKFGIEDITQTPRPLAVGFSSEQSTQAFQTILDRRFRSGTIISLANRMAQDTRNSTLHPTRGYQWALNTRIGGSGGRGDMAYAKFEAEGTYYTPLIGENKLIFCIHGFFGIVGSIGNNIIPYRELYNIGGPASVRGFTFGQISPNFFSDAIGGTKAFFVNTELIFPITKDFSIKGAFFYDGGAGWDTPDVCSIPEDQRKFLRNNNFEYRHAIGFGIRMLRPTPVKIDWGFKLDRKRGEKSTELHLSMYRDF